MSAPAILDPRKEAMPCDCRFFSLTVPASADCGGCGHPIERHHAERCDGPEPAPCSICRRSHGPEVVHACE